MSVTANGEQPARPATAKPVARSKPTGGTTLGQDSSREARRLAVVILEVLAGGRTPAQAATALAISLPRYYQLESRALRGLLTGCEFRPKGRTRSSDSELAALRRYNERLQREVDRQQSLVRMAQRSIGVAPPAPAAKAGAKDKKKRRRRPTVRALAAVAHLQQTEQEAAVSAAEPAATGS